MGRSPRSGITRISAFIGAQRICRIWASGRQLLPDPVASGLPVNQPFRGECKWPVALPRRAISAISVSLFGFQAQKASGVAVEDVVFLLSGKKVGLLNGLHGLLNAVGPDHLV